MLQVFRGEILHFLRDPGSEGDAGAWEHFPDGLLLVRDGRVEGLGPAGSHPLPSDARVTDYSGRLILPGFVDTHVHYVQTDVIASCGEQLLAWLDRYTFPAEKRFSEPAHAREVASFFVRELLRNGTTSALVLCSVHPTSVDAIFEAAAQAGLRILAGKVLMDRNCPEDLRDTAEQAYAESKELIERWHGRGRLRYAVIPRSAISSTPAQLACAARLVQEHDGVLMHTHVAENREEVAWAESLYPDSRSYVSIYDDLGLMQAGGILAHAIHLDAEDRALLARRGCSIAFCPSSNLFLGSGLFDLAAADEYGITVGLATDVGAGTSFSMLRTMGEAYKVLKLQGQALAPLRACYLATLGGARALHLDSAIGNLQPGKEADFLVLNWAATPLLARRMASASTLDERLGILMTLGDAACVEATYIEGRLAAGTLSA